MRSLSPEYCIQVTVAHKTTSPRAEWLPDDEMYAHVSLKGRFLQTDCVPRAVSDTTTIVAV